MTNQIALVLGAFVFLHFKHFLCDFPFQTDYQARTKGIYGHLGGISHAFTHALATMPVFILLRPTLALSLVIPMSEFLVHYHVDWLKEQVLRNRRWTSEDRLFWDFIGADQMLHNFTYVAIVAALWPAG